MLKRNITYEDFNGDTVTEVFYFNITKSEIIELDSSYEGGVSNVFSKIVESRDSEEVVKEFKKFILAAYGEKSVDGKRFMKVDENDKPLSRHFQQTAAYDALFIELATKPEAAVEFISGVFPKEFQTDIQKLSSKELPDPTLFPEHHGRVTGPITPKE